VELGNFLSPIMRRWWWVLCVATLLAGLAGHVVVRQLPAEYEARTRLLVGPNITDVDTLRASGQLARTYAELVTSQSVLEATSARLGLASTPASLTEAIRPTADGATRLLIIRVRNADPERAAAIANELAAQLGELAAGSSDRPDGLVTVIDPAIPGSPVGTSDMLVALLAAVAGLSLTFIVILVTEHFSESLGSDTDIARHGGLDVLCTVKTSAGPLSRTFPGSFDPARLRGEGHRVLAAKIEMSARAWNGRGGEEEARSDRSIRTIVVLGATGSGSTGAVAVSLASSLAEYGRRVVLIDADHRGAQVSTLLGMRNEPGLAEALAAPGSAAVQAERLAETTVLSHGLAVVPAGRRGITVSLAPLTVPNLVDRLLDDADVAVISADAPDRSPTALVWAGHADATVLAANRTRTRRQDLMSAIDSLRLVRASALGIVVTKGRGLRRWAAWRERTSAGDSDAPASPWDDEHALDLVGSSSRPLPPSR
jgi:polysaccharide biosynthesis transport protein